LFVDEQLAAAKAPNIEHYDCREEAGPRRFKESRKPTGGDQARRRLHGSFCAGSGAKAVARNFYAARPPGCHSL
jgi:hypothetical protein